MSRATGLVQRIWREFPAIGIILLFVAIAYGAYQGYKAREVAATAADLGRQNKILIQTTVAAKDAQIRDKDAQLAQRDNAIAGQVQIIGQLYNDALALQEQVTALGGKPKPIPVTLPTPGRPVVPSPSPFPATGNRPVPGNTPAPAPTQVPRPATSPAVNFQLQCLVLCPTPTPK